MAWIAHGVEAVARGERWFDLTPGVPDGDLLHSSGPLFDPATGEPVGTDADDPRPLLDSKYLAELIAAQRTRAGAPTTTMGDARDARHIDALRLDSAEVGAYLAERMVTSPAVRRAFDPVWQDDGDHAPYELFAELVQEALITQYTRETVAALTADPERSAGVVTGRLVADTAFHRCAYPYLQGYDRVRYPPHVALPGGAASPVFVPVPQGRLEARARELEAVRPGRGDLADRLRELRGEIGMPVPRTRAESTAQLIRAGAPARDAAGHGAGARDTERAQRNDRARTASYGSSRRASPEK
ncbi:MAG: hypothetical protein ACRDMV_03650 [Streptosporangiales bacterium]